MASEWCKWVVAILTLPIWLGIAVVVLVLLFITEIVGGDLADEAEREARKYDRNY